MKNKHLKILLSAPRGFCAGVERAIEIVEKSIKKFGAPVYVRHEIVHNKYVVDDLKNKGAIFVEELEEIEDKTRPVIFSAHGVPKKIPEDAKNYNMTYIDATCPLVSKVHREAENLHKAGYHLILIGHQNHPEVIGTMGQLPEGSIDLVQNEDEAKKYKPHNNKKISYVTQTTLSVDDTKDIIQILKDRFPEIYLLRFELYLLYHLPIALFGLHMKFFCCCEVYIFWPHPHFEQDQLILLVIDPWYRLLQGDFDVLSKLNDTQLYVNFPLLYVLWIPMDM